MATRTRNTPPPIPQSVQDDDSHHDNERCDDLNTIEPYEASIPFAHNTIGQSTKGEDRYGGIKTYTEVPNKGRYTHGYPQGAVVHFTAGRFEGQRVNSYNTWMRRRHLGCLFIESDGTLCQDIRLSYRYWHTGKTDVIRSIRSPAHNQLIGIEIACAGQLRQEPKGRGYVPWWSWDPIKQVTKPNPTIIPTQDVNLVTTGKGNVQRGAYHKYTEAQVHTLIATTLWLYHNNNAQFSLDNILGHDELTPRKNDPGGSLWLPHRNDKFVTMGIFRDYLKELAQTTLTNKAKCVSYYNDHKTR